MHGLQASHCAICRQPYKHFPSICLLLHFLILKLEPVAYKRREMEVLGDYLKTLQYASLNCHICMYGILKLTLFYILEEEKKDDVYSPQFMDQLELEKFNFGKTKVLCMCHLSV